MENSLTQHPFQTFRLETLPYCQDVNFANDENEIFEAYLHELNTAFHAAVESKKVLAFVNTYIDVSKKMLSHNHNAELMRPLLEDALYRLVILLHQFKNRGRQNFAEDVSVFNFQVDPKLLSDSCEVLDQMVQEGRRQQSYDLKRSPLLRRWILDHIKPLIEGYVGGKVYMPTGELRYADPEVVGTSKHENFRHHRFGNYHFDQNPYAFPFVIYLDEVDEECGPFTYIDGMDKISQNYVMRAFHQAMSICCKLAGKNDNDFAVLGQFPSIFRGGELVGTFTGPATFEDHKIVDVIGPAGSAVMFNGYHLVHSGGFPVAKTRKALFISFRYPQYKVGQIMGHLAAHYWRMRMR